MKMDITEFQNKNEERCVTGFDHKLSDWSFMEWGAATSGEIGEACNKAKKLKRIEQSIKGNKAGETKFNLKDDMAKEIVDGIIYSFLWLSAAGYNAEDVIREVFNSKSDEIGSDIKI
jgi:hypothetical protein